MQFDLEQFIYDEVIKRKESMFEGDIIEHAKELRECIEGKSVLVIGGAGSIGSSYIKAVLKFNPGKLVVVDINENALAELTRDLRASADIKVPEEYITYPMDFGSRVFEKMFRASNGFDIVANFSAHKHVRSEKDIFSVEALLQNNLIKAKGLLDLLALFPPEEYFCVSTDKAANPVNIMGASKRIMEDLIFSYSDCFPVKTARFANVAFSNGSLPEGFLRRIEKLQPIGAPSDVKRYFVAPEESGQICMLACMLGENREIFFPKLSEGQMMTFDRIAEELLAAKGYEVAYLDSDEAAVNAARELKNGSISYPVHFSSSDTSGEKAYEEFYVEGEPVNFDRFKALGVIEGKAIPDRDKVVGLLEKLSDAFEQEGIDKAGIVKIIAEYLPKFSHIETGKSLDGKL